MKILIAVFCLLITTGTLMAASAEDNKRHRYHDNIPTIYADYVVVGSGPAGSVLAGRLAEGDHCADVVLLERGPDVSQAPNPAWIEYVDGLIPVSANLDGLTEMLDTIPQPELNGRIIQTGVGNVAGGGGSRNSFGYRVPSKTTINSWNVDGWRWDDLKYEFRRVESRVHIQQLPYYPPPPPMQPIARAGFNAAGYVNNTYATLNGVAVGTFNGYSTISGPEQVPAKRENSYFSYVRDSSRLGKNLKFFSYRTVYKIEFNGKDAKGVLAYDTLNPSVIYRYRAHREVIITAGTFATAQILQLSGIGDQAALLAAGLQQEDIVLNNPNVGKNLWYHPNAQFFYYLNPAIALPSTASQVEQMGTSMIAAGPNQDPSAEVDYVISVAQLNIPGFPTGKKRNVDTAEYPSVSQLENGDFHVEYKGESYIIAADGKTRRSIVDVSTIDKKRQVPVTVLGFAEVHMVGAHSKGTVIINSTNINVKPVINYNFFQDPRDLQLAITSLGAGQTVLSNAQFSSLYLFRLIPDPSIDLTNPFVAEFYARAAVQDSYHTGGVAKMGNRYDNTRVTDTKARVVGVNDLRVCDLSIIPDRPRTNTFAMAMATGSKCASLILERHRGHGGRCH